MYLTIFLIFLNLFKVLIARYFPLIGDEAYYWLWSRHLDLCYVDHPPLIAYVNFILTSLFGNSELAFRLAAILIVLLISWIIYLTGKELYDPRAAALAVIIFNLLPTFFAGGMFLVPQILLFLFWSLSFYFFVKIIKTKEAKYWYWLGIAVGAGILSDYIMPLFIMGTAIFLLFSRENRFWFVRKEPYLALILALAVCSPIIIWNLKYASVGLATLGGRPVSFGRIGSNLLNFAGLQMILYTPVIFIMTLYLIFRDPGRNLALKVFSAVVFIPFALISPILNIGGHWPATAYLPAILNSHRAKKISIGLILFFALLVNSLGFAYYLFLYPTPDELKGQEFRTNAELPQFLKDASPKSGKTFYYANDLGMMGLVSFHGKVAVYMAAGRLKQADIWGRPAVQNGDNVIYFALNETPLYEKLEPMFVKVSIDPKKRIFAKDADIPAKTQIFICAGFKGGTLP